MSKANTQRQPDINFSRSAGVVLGALIAANFNVTTDQSITINSTRYVVRRILFTNASVNLTAAAGGIYTAASKGGTALVPAAQVYTALTATSKWIDATLDASAGTDSFTAATLFLSLSTGQGSAATADVYIIGDSLP